MAKRDELVSQISDLAEQISATCTDLIDSAADYETADRPSDRDEAAEAVAVTFGELGPDYLKLSAAVRELEKL